MVLSAKELDCADALIRGARQPVGKVFMPGLVTQVALYYRPLNHMVMLPERLAK
jgi:hypothetical protein